MEKQKNVNVGDLSLNFNLREPKGNKCTNVYAILKCGGMVYKFPIDCKVNTWQWSKKQQAPTVADNMTNEDRENNLRVLSVISAIRLGYMNFFSYLCNGSEEMTANEIREYFKQTIETIISNNDDMANNENLRRNGKPCKASTLLNKAFKVYYSEVSTQAKESTKTVKRNLLNQFFDYCEEIGKDTVSMLSQKGINDYKSFLLKKGNSGANVNNKVAIIVCLINNVIAIHNDFLRHRITKVDYIKVTEIKQKGDDKKRRALTNEELNKIMNCDTLTPKEKEYRDLFILECNCSYRVSDTPKMFDKSQQKHFKKNDVELMIINTKKENIDAVIWLTPTVKEIISRYENGFKYADLKCGNFTQTYNYQLKNIAKKSGLNTMEKYVNAHGETITQPLYEIIGSHFARYTFIRNGKDMGFTSSELKEFTAHADETMINEVYFSETKEDKANKAFKAIERVTNIQSNSTKESDKIQEYKDVLAFYGEPYDNYRDITDSEELFRIIVTKYEIPLKEKGYTTKILKEIYNCMDMDYREEREKLLHTLNEIRETIIAEMP